MGLLLWITFLPLLGAGILLCLPEERRDWERRIALGTSLAVAALGLGLFCFGFEEGSPRFQHRVSASWLRLPGSAESIHFSLGVDGLTLLLVTLTTILMPIVLVSSSSHIRHRVRAFLVWMLVMETGMLGVFLATDLFLFYCFWEVSLIPLYFILGIWGGERRLYATVKFFLYTVAGSLLMLIAAIALVQATGTTDLALLAERAPALDPSVQRWIFAGFAIAFAIKVPILPLHTWLADAHTEAPTSGSVVLAGVLLKLGTYGLLRYCIGLFPDAALEAAPLFLVLGGFGIVYGALLALAQSDLKRLVACSSVSHLGFVVLGLFALVPTGIEGSLLQMVNHGISTGLLFLLVGMVYERRHTRDLDQYGGLASSMPLFAIVFVVAMLSSAGVPGLNGFAGEYLILLGTFETAPWAAALGVSGVVLGAVYLLMATRRMLFGPIVHDENRVLVDLAPRELLTLAPLMVLVVVIGLAPAPFVRPSRAAVAEIDARLEAARGRRELAVAPQSDSALQSEDTPETASTGSPSIEDVDSEGSR